MYATITNGALDDNFGTDGRVTTEFGNADDFGSSILLQPDGKIVVAGSSFQNGDFDYAIARYNGDGALPVALIDFNAVQSGKTILLTWKTASELNNKYFSIEHSVNGTGFNEISKVKSKGNSYVIQQYNYEDVTSVNGEHYYRLKQVDADGRFTYSKIVHVDFLTSQTIKLYPNPVKNMLLVEGLNAASNTTLSIVDLWGKLVHRVSINRGSYKYNLQQLQAGSYYLKVEADKRITAVKFIKQ